MRFGILGIGILFCLANAHAQIHVSTNHRFLVTKDEQPFFWLGDTEWELFHRLTREEIDEVLETRRRQGFNVIQAVALAEFNGIHGPNRYGDLPLIDDDPTRLNVTAGDNPTDSVQYDYWDHVEYAIQTAASKGLYIGLLPTWGDKVAHLWGDGPLIFNRSNAEVYAITLARRFGKYWNIIWILGGDRPASYSVTRGDKEIKYDDREVWRAMADGIESILGHGAFITYHPAGGSRSTSQFIQDEKWLDMNSFQSGHGSRDADPWNWVLRDLALKPAKPTLDMEPCYEDHPVNPWDGKWSRARGYFSAYDVRARIYRSVFAGACGVTYGHHQVWQFMNPDLFEPINVGDTIIPWRKALYAEAAEQMKYLKRLVLSRPSLTRISDPSIIVNPGTSYQDLAVAARDASGSYSMIYVPTRRPIDIDISHEGKKPLAIWTFDPVTGQARREKDIQRSIGSRIHVEPPESVMRDWIIVVDDSSKGYRAPGE